jgi:hypothetical protein
MHRSGTSLVASWLQRCELAIDHGGLVGPAIGNPLGHFEDVDFIRLHASSIKSLVPGSYGWKVFANRFLPFTEEERQRANEIVKARTEMDSLWGWKDPRSVVFLRQWREIIPDLKVLLVWRPCHEVVKSLVSRAKRAHYHHYKIGTYEAVKLWLSYNGLVYAYKGQSARDTLLLPLNYILKNDRETLQLIESKLNIKLRYRPISDLYVPTLLHRETPPPQLRLLALSCGAHGMERRLTSRSDGELT